MSPILRHFSQDKGGAPQKNAINWGLFHIYAKKPGKSGISWLPIRSPKAIGPRGTARTARFAKLLCVDSGRFGARILGALADARRLAGASAQVIELGATHLA